MKIQSLLNGGFAEVEDAAAQRLVADGHWVVAGEVKPAPAVRKRSPRRKLAASPGE